MQELFQILKSHRKQQHEQNTFLAALKGVDLNKNKGEDETPEFEKVKRRAEARIKGLTEEQLQYGEERAEFGEVGIQVEEWEGE